MKHLAILASGGGSNAKAILNYFQNHSECKIAVIATENPHAGVIQIAESYHISVHIFQNYKDSSEMAHVFSQYKIDGIILAGYLKLIPQPIVQTFSDKIINIHPSLLPDFGGKGMYGMKVHTAVIQSKSKYSGITIHLVNAEYDKGEIICQVRLPVSPDWDAKQLQQEVLRLEHRFFPVVIECWAEKL